MKQKKENLPCGRPAPKKVDSPKSSKELLEKIRAQLNTYCLEKKLNRSETRDKILYTIVYESRHFTAIDLLEKLQKNFPEIGKATLYRNLPVFVNSGILQEGPHDTNGQVLYELSEDDHHDHIVCLDCKMIFEFHDKSIEKRQAQISSDYSFSPKDHHHVIYANCDFLKNHQK